MKDLARLFSESDKNFIIISYKFLPVKFLHYLARFLQEPDKKLISNALYDSCKQVLMISYMILTNLVSFFCLGSKTHCTTHDLFSSSKFHYLISNINCVFTAAYNSHTT